jgi:hypothetical protein
MSRAEPPPALDGAGLTSRLPQTDEWPQFEE